MKLHTDSDLIIRVAARRRATTTHGRSNRDENARDYDAYVYATMPLPMLTGTPSTEGDEECRGLPLRGVAPLSIRWSRYQDLLAQFFEREKGLEPMYYRMRDTLSEPLRKLVDFVRAYERPLRVWWSNDTPELDDMPWDLLFYGQYQDREHYGPARTSCVRGLPPMVPPPLLAVSGPLRVLLDAERTPDWLQQLLRTSIPNLTCIPFYGPAREAFVKARAEGYESLHLAVDGIVSLAYDGVLYRHGDPVPEVSAAEVSQLLAGSRLSLLSLTPQAVSSPDVAEIAGRDVVSVYRAFACFAASRVTLPSMVVPIGPTPNEAATKTFWDTFYRGLAATHDAEKALASARHEVPESPHSLFLRHAQGKLFRSADPVRRSAEGLERRSMESPERLAMLVRGFAEANTQAEAIKQRYGGELPDYLRDLLSNQQEHQASIEADLEAWARPEGDQE